MSSSWMSILHTYTTIVVCILATLVVFITRTRVCIVASMVNNNNTSCYASSYIKIIYIYIYIICICILAS